MPNAAPTPQPLDRETLQQLCTELSAEMERRNTRVNAYIVADRVFTTAWHRDAPASKGDERPTSDRDAVDEAVRTVADRHGAPYTWLDDLACAYPPSCPDVPAPVVLPHRRGRCVGRRAC